MFRTLRRIFKTLLIYFLLGRILELQYGNKLLKVKTDTQFMFEALPIQINSYQNTSKTNRQNLLQYILNIPRNNKMCNYGQNSISTKPDARHDHKLFSETAWDINRRRSLLVRRKYWQSCFYVFFIPGLINGFT